MGTIQKDRILELPRGGPDRQAGDKIGKIEEIYLDADTGEPEWALVHTGLFGTKQTFVPLRDATEDDGASARAVREGRRSRTRRASIPTASSPRTRRPSSTATTAELLRADSDTGRARAEALAGGSSATSGDTDLDRSDTATGDADYDRGTMSGDATYAGGTSASGTDLDRDSDASRTSAGGTDLDRDASAPAPSATTSPARRPTTR